MDTDGPALLTRCSFGAPIAGGRLHIETGPHRARWQDAGAVPCVSCCPQSDDFAPVFSVPQVKSIARASLCAKHAQATEHFSSSPCFLPVAHPPRQKYERSALRRTKSGRSAFHRGGSTRDVCAPVPRLWLGHRRAVADGQGGQRDERGPARPRVRRQGVAARRASRAHAAAGFRPTTRPRARHASPLALSRRSRRSRPSRVRGCRSRCCLR